MTNEEAIKYLIRPTVMSTKVGKVKQKEIDAYDMAVKALEKKSVIEDIKAEIKDLRMNEGYWQFDRGLMKALEIIDKHISGKEKE